jgi:hypothetical protein
MTDNEWHGLLSKRSIRKRGWSDDEIAHLLGQPDEIGPPPHVPHADPLNRTKWYRVDRVEALEAGELAARRRANQQAREEQQSEEKERLRRRAEVRRTHYYLAQLKRRGWTETEVERFLGDADARLSNPWGQGPDMRLYRRERVEAMEQTEEYQAFHAALLERRRRVGRPEDAVAGRKEVEERERERILRQRILARRRAQGYRIGGSPLTKLE